MGMLPPGFLLMPVLHKVASPSINLLPYHMTHNDAYTVLLPTTLPCMCRCATYVFVVHLTFSPIVRDLKSF